MESPILTRALEGKRNGTFVDSRVTATRGDSYKVEGPRQSQPRVMGHHIKCYEGGLHRLLIYTEAG